MKISRGAIAMARCGSPFMIVKAAPSHDAIVAARPNV